MRVTTRYACVQAFGFGVCGLKLKNDGAQTRGLLEHAFFKMKLPLPLPFSPHYKGYDGRSTPPIEVHLRYTIA